ncbi:hypothetical protein KC19_2G225000 [Ceratodon purpureus]|uniref:Uncharacterized protein n=1 Tax=Ceratodon purpureus TaxID=3225 RepID=A0A8T0IZM4_CERPU|nr:hypothetical protein KC19_2G225000 [Ceratodon purpureus]
MVVDEGLLVVRFGNIAKHIEAITLNGASMVSISTMKNWTPPKFHQHPITS